MGKLKVCLLQLPAPPERLRHAIRYLYCVRVYGRRASPMRSRSEACELCATPTAPSRHTSDSLLRSKTPTTRPDPRVR